MAGQRARGNVRRRISLLLLASLLVLGTAIQAASQCAYPALELLEFSYVNSPWGTQRGADGRTVRNVCLTALKRETGKQEARATRIEYEFEGRLFVFQTLLRWLGLDATAEAWTPLPSSAHSQ